MEFYRGGEGGKKIFRKQNLVNIFYIKKLMEKVNIHRYNHHLSLKKNYGCKKIVHYIIIIGETKKPV